MTDTPKTELLIPLEDEETDPLFEKADALMQRHATFAIEPELDDLPVLTEVVEALAPTPDTPAEPPMVTPAAISIIDGSAMAVELMVTLLPIFMPIRR